LPGTGVKIKWKRSLWSIIKRLGKLLHVLNAYSKKKKKNKNKKKTNKQTNKQTNLRVREVQT
jgi:hypothetical protein